MIAMTNLSIHPMMNTMVFPCLGRVNGATVDVGGVCVVLTCGFSLQPDSGMRWVDCVKALFLVY